MRPIIQNKTKMNGTEAAYASCLEMLKRSGQIIDWKFEAIKLKLADKTFYTPDFFVVKSDHFELHEVKGFWRDDARVKIKVAAQMFPWFKWIVVKKGRGKGWNMEEI